MNQTAQRTFHIPITGYFAEPGTHPYKIPKAPDGVNEETLVRSIFYTDEYCPPKPLKSHAVQLLASVRDQKDGIGPMWGTGCGTPAYEYVQAHGLVEPVEYVNNDYLLNPHFKVTEAGHEFMRKHEAPECW